MTIRIVYSKSSHLLDILFSNTPTVQLTAASCALLTTLSSALLQWSIGLHKLMILSLTLFYKVEAPLPSPLIIKAVPFVWEMFIGSRYLKPLKAVSSSLWDTNNQKEGTMTMPNMKNAEVLDNIKFEHDLT